MFVKSANFLELVIDRKFYLYDTYADNETRASVGRRSQTEGSTLNSRWITLEGQRTYINRRGSCLVGAAAYRASILEKKMHAKQSSKKKRLK